MAKQTGQNVTIIVETGQLDGSLELKNSHITEIKGNYVTDIPGTDLSFVSVGENGNPAQSDLLIVSDDNLIEDHKNES